MVGPFSINTYLPSFAAMEAALATTPVALQQSVSIYFMAFAFMALWHGAISDSFGRRRVVLTGLFVYAMASLACVFVTAIEQLWILRAFQGFSAGAGIVTGRAIVRDLHDGPLAQRMMSQVVLMFGLAPAIAPLVGGWLQVTFGWRAVFLFLCMTASSLFIAVVLRLPETLPLARRQPFRLADLARAYAALLANRAFMTWAFAYSMMFGCFFLYVLSAPMFLMRHLHVGETEFLWLFGPATAGLVLGSALAGRFAQRWDMPTTLTWGFAIMGGATIYNLAVCLMEPAGVLWYVIFIFIFNLGMSLTIPTLTIRGLDCAPSRRGMASSVQLFIQTGFNAFIAAVLAPLMWGSLLSLAIGAALLFIGAGTGVLLARRFTR